MSVRKSPASSATANTKKRRARSNVRAGPLAGTEQLSFPAIALSGFPRERFVLSVKFTTGDNPRFVVSQASARAARQKPEFIGPEPRAHASGWHSFGLPNHTAHAISEIAEFVASLTNAGLRLADSYGGWGTAKT